MQKSRPTEGICAFLLYPIVYFQYLSFGSWAVKSVLNFFDFQLKTVFLVVTNYECNERHMKTCVLYARLQFDLKAYALTMFLIIVKLVSHYQKKKLLSGASY